MVCDHCGGSEEIAEVACSACLRRFARCRRCGGLSYAFWRRENHPCAALVEGTTPCVHQWRRCLDVELANGPHVFECADCGLYGWRGRVRRRGARPGAAPDPIREYGAKRQQIMRTRTQTEARVVTARPMSARRGRHGGYVPGGASGGRR